MMSEFCNKPSTPGVTRRGSDGAVDEVCPSPAAEDTEGTELMDVSGPHEALEVAKVPESWTGSFLSWAWERQLNEKSVLSYDARSRLLFQAKDRLSFVPLQLDDTHGPRRNNWYLSQDTTALSHAVPSARMRLLTSGPLPDFHSLPLVSLFKTVLANKMKHWWVVAITIIIIVIIIRGDLSRFR